MLWGIGKQIKLDGPDVLILAENGEWMYEQPNQTGEALFKSPKEAKSIIKAMVDKGELEKNLFLVGRS